MAEKEKCSHCGEELVVIAEYYSRCFTESITEIGCLCQTNNNNPS